MFSIRRNKLVLVPYFIKLYQHKSDFTTSEAAPIFNGFAYEIIWFGNKKMNRKRYANGIVKWEK